MKRRLLQRRLLQRRLLQRALFSAGLAAFWVTSCLVPSPPEFEGPRQTRPNFNLDTISPPTGQILVVRNGEEIPINVQFESEDAGEVIQWQLYLNYGLPDETRIFQRTAPAGRLEEGEREIGYTWIVGAIEGQHSNCQQLTLLATHTSNIPEDDPQRPLDGSDVAFAQWWVNMNAAIGEQQTLLDCPSVTDESMAN